MWTPPGREREHKRLGVNVNVGVNVNGCKQEDSERKRQNHSAPVL